VLSAAGSAVVGVVLGDRLSVLDAAGVVVACGAIALVSLEQEAADGARSWRARPGAGVLDGIAAGVGFALLFVGLHRAGAASRLWPVAVSQGVGLVLIAMLALGLATSGRVRLPAISGIWSGAVPAGLLGAGATIAYFAATQLGLLSVSAVLTSLYPASTVVLAVTFLHERPTRIQVAGLGLAALAVVLLAVRS
jgi:drug/metabolite transporter (DMT)-like permease